MSLKEIKTYEEYKRAFDEEMLKSAEGFVRIGYLLRRARDTQVLWDSGYANVFEFAQAEYGLDKSQVSRFININIRFSEGGYGEQLQEKFRGYGQSKLAVMLQLPDGIIEQISPEYTREELTDLKNEVKEEFAESTPLEAMMNAPEQEEGELTEALKACLRQRAEDFRKLYETFETEKDMEDLRVGDILAPAGEAILSIRIQGKGRATFNIRPRRDVKIYYILLNESVEWPWDALMLSLEDLMQRGSGYRDSWERIYGEPYPEEVKEEEEKPEKKPARVVTQNKKEQKNVQKPDKNVHKPIVTVQMSEEKEHKPSATEQIPEEKEQAVTTCCVQPRGQEPVRVADMPEPQEGSGAEVAPEQPAEHELKIWPEFFEPTLKGIKHFEARLNDRGFKVGDILILKEYNITRDEYTGRELRKTVEYILEDHAFVREGYVIMSWR